MEETCVREDGQPVSNGDRLECEGQFATIRYIGAVSPTKGLWLGVEWDDPSRGKHNGTHEGHTYFTTQHPTSGSFIRPKKAKFGMSLMAAIQDRYGKMEDENAGVITDELYVVSSSNKQTVVEMVGAKKVNELQGHLNMLKEVVLREMLVYGTLGSHDLSQLVPSIVEMDISKCLLPSWKSVEDITCQLKNLEALNVSENKLQFPDDPSALVPSFSHVKRLFLNRMGYTWNKVLQVCDMFSGLEQIHTCFNCIETLSSVEGRFSKMRLVNLESNKISDWSQILFLSKLPLLETLIVSDNQIPSINFDDTDVFPALKSLTINSNQITDWSSINELNKVPHLEELRIKSNPIMTSTNIETVRQLLIAKLKHLKSCNRTEIFGEERKGSEIDYLKRFGPEWIKSGGNQDPSKNNPTPEFLRNHPRFNELVKEWGAPENSEMQQKATTLKNTLITIKISCPNLPEKKIIEKKIPGSMTVQKLKALIQRLYKLDSEIELSYLSEKMQGEEIELDNDQRFLSYYSIEPGDTIQVKV